MELKTLFLSPFTATFEIENDSPYFVPHAYEVLLDGEKKIAGGRKNVFSLEGLTSDKEHHLSLKTEKEVLELNFRTPKVNYVLTVKDFGAKGDGETDDTLAIQAAIMACPPDGVVYFPKGNYRFKNIFLKNDLQIYLPQGSRLVASPNREDYPVLPGVLRGKDGERLIGTWEGNPLAIYASPLTGLYAERVRIFGGGEIDCSANLGPWWMAPKKKFLGFRPRGIFLNHCRDVELQGITLKNTASWAIHPFYSAELGFYDLKIFNPHDAPNTDGLNPESSQNIKIIGVHFSVGDDCIAIKSGKIYMARKHLRPTANLLIRNCLMERGHGAVVFGSEISGGAENVTVSKCVFRETDRGLRIKTRRGRGNRPINNIVFKNIRMEGVENALVINMFYNCDPDGKTEYVYSKNPLPVDERTPVLGSFRFQDISAENTKVSAGYFYGLPESPIQEISLENIRVDYSEEEVWGKPAMMSFIEDHSKLGFYFNNVACVKVKNVTLAGQRGEEFIFENVRDIDKN